MSSPLKAKIHCKAP